MGNFLKLFPQLDDPAFKGVIEASSDTLKFHAIASNGTFLKRILKQQFYSKFISHACRSTYFCKTFDEKIQQLITGGLVDYIDQEYMKFLKPDRYEHLLPKGPKVLTMKHLKAGFIVSFVPLLFAILAFFCEWLIRFFEYIMVKETIQVYYKLVPLKAFKTIKSVRFCEPRVCQK